MDDFLVIATFLATAAFFLANLRLLAASKVAFLLIDLPRGAPPPTRGRDAPAAAVAAGVLIPKGLDWPAAPADAALITSDHAELAPPMPGALLVLLLFALYRCPTRLPQPPPACFEAWNDCAELLELLPPPAADCDIPLFLFFLFSLLLLPSSSNRFVSIETVALSCVLTLFASFSRTPVRDMAGLVVLEEVPVVGAALPPGLMVVGLDAVLVSVRFYYSLYRCIRTP
mmetsp:Transcript_15224/g.30748  ORF Transcript_15224/g.30748 Transcript_15224/m.30748 type:complete len:228 (-) Transcript_15224:10-693(-)